MRTPEEDVDSGEHEEPLCDPLAQGENRITWVHVSWALALSAAALVAASVGLYRSALATGDERADAVVVDVVQHRHVSDTDYHVTLQYLGVRQIVVHRDRAPRLGETIPVYFHPGEPVAATTTSASERRGQAVVAAVVCVPIVLGLGAGWTVRWRLRRHLPRLVWSFRRWEIREDGSLLSVSSMGSPEHTYDLRTVALATVYASERREFRERSVGADTEVVSLSYLAHLRWSGGDELTLCPGGWRSHHRQRVEIEKVVGAIGRFVPADRFMHP